jgi:hypothetical protein
VYSHTLHIRNDIKIKEMKFSYIPQLDVFINPSENLEYFDHKNNIKLMYVGHQGICLFYDMHY